MPIVDDILAHYGVNGMRWGVRKEQESSSRPTVSPKKQE